MYCSASIPVVVGLISGDNIFLVWQSNKMHVFHEIILEDARVSYLGDSESKLLMMTSPGLFLQFSKLLCDSLIIISESLVIFP